MNQECMNFKNKRWNFVAAAVKVLRFVVGGCIHAAYKYKNLYHVPLCCNFIFIPTGLMNFVIISFVSMKT